MIKDDFLYALSLSEEMLVFAQNGEWDKFNALDEKRNLILKKYSEESEGDNTLDIDEQLSLQLEEWVLEIQKLNQRIETIADSEKSSAQSELTQANKNSKAINAYKKGF